MALQPANAPASPAVCSTQPYIQFAQLKTFPAAITWCKQLSTSKTKPPPIGGCPVGSQLCAVLALLENNAYNFASTACSCIGYGPATTISVKPSPTSSTKTSSSSSTSKTSSKTSSSTSKTPTVGVTPSVTPSITPSVTPSITPSVTPVSTTPVPAPTACPNGEAPVVEATCNTFPYNGGSYQVTYTQYYSGHSFTEDPNNPGNNDPTRAPQVSYLAGNYTMCYAAQECVYQANRYQPNYDSFDLHYLCSANPVWECNIYAGPNTDNRYFNVSNPEVLAGFGYSTAPNILSI